MAKAVESNRRLSQDLDWGRFIPDIEERVLKLTLSPMEDDFAREVARWQQARKLKADGIIGKNTWALMRALIPAANTSLPATVKPASGTPPPVIVDTGKYIKSLSKIQKDRVAYIISLMEPQGISNAFAKAAILAIISKENEFTLKEEGSYANTSNERIRKIFGKRLTAYKTDAALNALKADPVKFFNAVYGNRGGNAADEGYKYRGRGFNQITFKERYERVGKQIGADLVSKPELLTDLPVATKAVLQDFVDRFKQAPKERLQHYNTTGINGFSSLDDAVGAFYHANAGWGKSYEDVEGVPTQGRKRAFERAPEFLKLVQPAK